MSSKTSQHFRPCAACGRDRRAAVREPLCPACLLQACATPAAQGGRAMSRAMMARARANAEGARARADRLSVDPSVPDDGLRRELDAEEAAYCEYERALCVEAFLDRARAARGPYYRMRYERALVAAELERREAGPKRCLDRVRADAERGDLPASLRRAMGSIVSAREADLRRRRPARIAQARSTVRRRLAEHGPAAPTMLLSCAPRARSRSPRRPRTARRSSSRSGDSGAGGDPEPPPRRAACRFRRGAER